MTDPAKLSVVIVAWNSANEIAAAVASCRSKDTQVIVVDNASSDGSGAIARDAGADLVIETGSNLGFARGCNLGLESAVGDVVLFLNPDARLVDGPGALLGFFDTHGHAALLGPAVMDEDGRLGTTAGRKWTLLTELMNKTLLHRLRRPPTGTGRVAWVSGAALAGRARDLRRLGGFDPGFFLYYEDLDLCARASAAGLQVWYSDAVRVVHAGKRSSSSVEKQALLWSERSTQRYWRRHGGRLGAAAVRAMTLPEMGLRSAVWALLAVDPHRRARARVRLSAYRAIAALTVGWRAAPDEDLPGLTPAEPQSTGPPAPTAGRPLVSVVIATYNRASMVSRAIESALGQQYQPVEVIVVDDGSTDDTAAVLDSYAGSIKVVHQQNRERGAARNAGLAVASGELIAFLDSDDEWLEDHLGPLVDVLGRHPRVGLAYRQAEFYDDETGLVFDVLPRHPRDGELFRACAAGNLMVVDAVLVRRSLLDEVGWFDEARELAGMEDWELWTRCLGASSVSFVAGRSTRVHFHARNTVGDRVAMERAIRSASTKILSHPLNVDRLAPDRARLRAGMWALLAHLQMLAGDSPAARARLREGLREDPRAFLYPVFWSMALKVLAGPGLIRKGRVARRALHLRMARGREADKPGRLRVLALDHYFQQDLSSLEAHPGIDLRRIPFDRLRTPALQVLGKDVAGRLDAFSRPELAPARDAYRDWLRGEVARMYLEKAFDVVVLPSDTFFYVRSLPEVAHELGIPVVVVQKETVISPDSLEADSQVIGEHAPFTADLMTCCSEAHKAFWAKAGADPARIVVTGQPRFDIYAVPSDPPAAGARKVLFLSYELDAYQPGVGGGLGLRTWEPLRAASERALLMAAETGRCQVLVKPHPQQSRVGEIDRLRSLAGARWGNGFSMADPEADVRDLIKGAHVVVGFQTTGLYEAAAAGRPVIYAAWGEAYERNRHRLIPYHLAPQGCLWTAGSADELAELLLRELPPPPPGAREWYEEPLGPIDGHATRRVVDVLTNVAAAWPAGAKRKALDDARPRFAAALLARSLLSEAIWLAAEVPAGLLGRRLGVIARRHRAAGNRRLALAGLGGRLTGPGHPTPPRSGRTRTDGIFEP